MNEEMLEILNDYNLIFIFDIIKKTSSIFVFLSHVDQVDIFENLDKCFLSKSLRSK